MFIQNVSFDDIKRGQHRSTGENSVLIQIVDHGMEFPVPFNKFGKTYQFNFMDVERGDELEEFGIMPDQAEQLVEVLTNALNDKSNVIVHCVAGLCRSGAIVEVGVMMGFDDTGTYRSPNVMVKHALMRELGWTYDADEKPAEIVIDDVFRRFF